MAKENTFRVTLTETEMRTALESINKTAYLGQVSDVVSSIRKKLNVDELEPIGRRKRKPKPETPKE